MEELNLSAGEITYLLNPGMPAKELFKITLYELIARGILSVRIEYVAPLPNTKKVKYVYIGKGILYNSVPLKPHQRVLTDRLHHSDFVQFRFFIYRAYKSAGKYKGYKNNLVLSALEENKLVLKPSLFDRFVNRISLNERAKDLQNKLLENLKIVSDKAIKQPPIIGDGSIGMLLLLLGYSKKELLKSAMPSFKMLRKSKEPENDLLAKPIAPQKLFPVLQNFIALPDFLLQISQLNESYFERSAMDSLDAPTAGSAKCRACEEINMAVGAQIQKKRTKEKLFGKSA